MRQNGDDLELQISASVKKAEKAIDSLVAKLDVLQTSLTGVSAGGASKAADAFAEMAKQSKAAGKASKTFNSGMEKTDSAMRKTQKSAWSLASAFGKFYASYFMVIRGIKGLWRSIESTTDYIEAFNYFDVAFGKIASEWNQDFEKFGYNNAQAYADSFTKRMTDSLGDLSGLTLDANRGLLTASGTKNLALNIQEITQSASQLASITNSIGLVGEVSLTTADSFTKLAADMSSLFNIDFSSAMKNLQSGLIGQSRALYKYGIDITNATLQTYAYQLGLSKAVSEMTQSEKMQLRMLAILDQSKVAWGDLANTINSPSNMIRQLTNNLKEAGMVLGQLFIPMLQKVLPVLNGITIAIKNLLVNIASFFGVQLDLSSFGQGYSDMGDSIDGVTDSLGDATAAAKKLKTVTLGIDELNINSPQENSGTSTGGIGGGIDLTDEILKATEEYQKIWDAAFAGMENKAQEFAEKVSKFFEPLTKSLKEFGKGEISFGELLADIVSFTVTGLETALTNALEAVNWYKVGESIYDFIKNIDYVKIFGKAIDLGKVVFKIIPKITIGFGKNLFWDALSKAFGFDKKDAQKFIDQETKGKGLEGGLTYELVVPLVLDYFASEWDEKATKINEWMDKHIFSLFSKKTWVEKGAEIGVGLGTALSNISKWCTDTKEKFNKWKENTSETIETWKENAEEKFNTWKTNVSTTISNFKSDAESKFKNWKTNVLSTISAWKSDVETKFTNWKTNVSNTINTWKTNAETKFATWKTNVEGTINTWKTNVEGKFDTWKGNVEITFTNWKKNVSDTIDTWKSDAEEKINAWRENAEGKFGDFKKNTEYTISTWYENISSFFGFDKWNFDGIKEGLSTAFDSALSGIKYLWNKFANWVNEKLTWTIDPLVVAGKTLFKGATIDLGQLPTFATGGFPEDGLFMANHNELVGQFSNGRTAVANNEQIIAGIKEGVREAVSEILAPYLSDIARNTRETADKDFAVNIGDREIARANARGQRSMGFTLITE